MNKSIPLILAAGLVLTMSGCQFRPDTVELAPTLEPVATITVAPEPANTEASELILGEGAGPQDTYTVQAQPPAGSCTYRYDAGQPLPDPACTPGALNPAVTPETLEQTICRSGYTDEIRPSTSITGKEKELNAASYNYTGDLHDAEYDHLISLQLGGDPNDPRNLWVEPPSPGHTPGTGVNNDKDKVETKIKTAICDGLIDLRQAQSAIATNWTTALSVLGL